MIYIRHTSTLSMWAEEVAAVARAGSSAFLLSKKCDSPGSLRYWGQEPVQGVLDEARGRRSRAGRVPCFFITKTKRLL